MRYVSPASLFGPTPDLADKRALQLAKKKLLTEFELSDDGQLTINGMSMTKNDVLEYFDTLETPAAVSYHQAVAKDKALTRFLETARIALGTSFARQDLYADDGFIRWISPYFYTSFTEAAKYYLQKTDGQGLKDLLANPLLLTDYDRERAWFSIAQVLESNVALLEQYQREARKKRGLDVDAVLPLISQPLLEMILLLPKEPFSRVRDNYAHAVMQLSIQLFNKNRWRRDLADVWIYRAGTLAASDSVRDNVTKKAHQMTTLRKKGERSWGIRVAIVVAIIVLRMLFGEKGCNAGTGSGDHPFYTRLTTKFAPCTTSIQWPYLEQPSSPHSIPGSSSGKEKSCWQSWSLAAAIP